MNTYGVAIVSRNDNYGGNLNEVASYVLNSCIASYDEVVFVDWNSPGNTLIEDIQNNLLKTGKLKCVVVTPEDHKRFTSDFELPQDCCEVLGRNVGIRRLTTDFRASTNIDEINPPRNQLELITDLTKFITVARHGTDFPHIKSLGNYEEIDKIRNYLLNNKYPQAWPIKMTDNDVWSLVGWCGDLQIAHKDIWFRIRGYEESQKGRGFADSYIQRKAIELGIPVEVSYNTSIYHIDHHHNSNTGVPISRLNDIRCFSDPFYGTTNPETWGLSNERFREFTV